MKPDNTIILIGEKIRAVRKSKKLSQENLAEFAGLHPTYISDIENGKVSASLQSYFMVAKGLGMPLSELINLPEGKPDEEFEKGFAELVAGVRALPRKKQGTFLKASMGLLDGIREAK